MSLFDRIKPLHEFDPSKHAAAAAKAQKTLGAFQKAPHAPTGHTPAMQAFDKPMQARNQAKADARKHEDAGPSLGARIGARALTEQTEAEAAAHPRPLLEDLVAARSVRFFSPRDIQYAIEDLATAAERFQERDSRFSYMKLGRRGKDSCEDEKKAKAMLEAALKELRESANAVKKYADLCDADY